MTLEVWKSIPEFSQYRISNLGRVFNMKTDSVMRTSITTFGHVKISLKSEIDGERYTRSVAHMVAEAFVEPPSWRCDHVILLDGEFDNVVATNLAWRPRGYAWQYTRQLKEVQPIHFHNLRVHNIITDYFYNSIIEAGMIEGLLFGDIWRSTYTGAELFPYGHIFEIVQRV